jgi:chromosome segregation ATPase
LYIQKSEDFLAAKVVDLRRFESLNNEATARSFKLLQTHLSLYNSVMKNKQENQRLEEVNEKLRDLCRLSQQRLKLALETHDASTAKSDQHFEDLVEKVRTTVGDIQSKISNQGELKIKQDAENIDLRAKIDEFKSHSKMRSEHFETQLRAKCLELQLSEAKLDQQLKIAEQERTRIESFKTHVSQLKQSEKELKMQVTMYDNKFEEFQDALTKSEEAFANFQERINGMEESNKKLMGENEELLKMKNALDVKLILAFDEKTKLAEDLASENAKKSKIEKVCRALQTERAAKKNEGEA